MSGLNDLIINLRGGYKTYRESVLIVNTKKNRQILKLLYLEGYILGYKIHTNSSKLEVKMRYLRKRPAILDLKAVSKCSRPIFLDKNELYKKYSIGGAAVISTTRGIYLYRNGREIDCGGEILFEII